MQHGAHIGASVVIKGAISALEPLTISGRVDGSIEAPGHIVTVEAGSVVTADIAAAAIVVGGTVKGALVAEDRIVLRTGADVEGDLTAPRISVDDGACVSGKALIAGPRAVNLARAS
jgi:cytoskeletal protein CcmA (bactofilin family)